jgi:tetratricopeptide (TPR) repeat protein
LYPAYARAVLACTQPEGAAVRTYTFEVFKRSEQSFDLRLFGPDGSLKGRRSLELAEIERLAQEVELEYDQPAPRLDRLGARLYEWLNGQERWLEEALAHSQGLTLRIDVSERLSHLPWELLYRSGNFLCNDPLRPCLPARYSAGPPKSLQCDNRPLRLLFMASSATNVEPTLDFEDEERKILEATRSSNLLLQLLVEESGTLRGLEERLNFHGSGYFDIVHLSGHAGFRADGQPCFIMEDEVGQRAEVTAEQLAEAFSGHFPKLLFLSACSTARATGAGGLPSLCERLVAMGAPAVLGWSLKVGDEPASLAAAALYKELAAGHSVALAVARGRQALFKGNSRFWHMLRLYTGKLEGPGLLSALVTAPGAPGRESLRWLPARQSFLDAGSKKEVCPRELFVGRRRQIQRCLRVLRSSPGDEKVYAEGLLLQGIGGQGKTSLATRLCERMEGHERVVWVGRVDEIELLRGLSDRLDSVEANARLNEGGLELKQRLRRLFREVLPGRPLLFIFDDFEDNLEVRGDGTYHMRGEAQRGGAQEVLSALLAAIRDTASPSRVIVTSRYGFAVPGPARLELVSLGGLQGADLDKKTERLTALSPYARTEEEVRKRAKELSAGNPRLLERLDQALQEKGLDATALLNKLSVTAEGFREEILLKELLGHLQREGERLLSRCSVYDLPVERSVFEAVVQGKPLDPHLPKAISLGLVEVDEVQDGAQRYRVTGLVRPLLSLTEQERQEAASLAVRHLYGKYWKDDHRVKYYWAEEIHRLAISARDSEIARRVGASTAWRQINLSRYREAAKLCRETLQVGEDYDLFHALARAEQVLGETDHALAHYERALADCPAGALEGNPELAKERGGILHNLAGLVAQQGDIPRALALWQQSLQLYEQVGDLQGKAATLNNMAGVIAQQGDIPRALALWQQSLQLLEQVGDLQGKATTLANMAWAAGSTGDQQRKRELYIEAAKMLAVVRAWPDLTTVLGNLGNSEDQDASRFLAQALWLAVRVTVPVEGVVGLSAITVQKLTPVSDLSPLIASLSLFLVKMHGQQHPKQEDLMRNSAALLAACAAVRNVELDKIVEWIQQEGLNDPRRLLPAVLRGLEELVGEEGWLFDRKQFPPLSLPEA